jgi:nitroreductase
MMTGGKGTMDFKDVLQKRRSIRDFQEKNVPMNVIEEILQESTFAASASNNQPCRFAIVHCKKTIKALSDESKANLLDDYAKDKRSLLPKYIDLLKDANFNVFYNAPCVIFIIGSKSVASLDVDCALAASYIMFSAVDRGLGTCWINLGSQIRDPQLKALLGIPDGCRIVAPIIMGYPKAISPVSERHAPQILKVIS